MICRFCQNELINEFVDLGYSPPSNSFLSYKQLNSPETFYPLKIMVCEKCFLVQLDEFAKHDDIFNEEYVYFSICKLCKIKCKIKCKMICQYYIICQFAQYAIKYAEMI